MSLEWMVINNCVTHNLTEMLFSLYFCQSAFYKGNNKKGTTQTEESQLGLMSHFFSSRTHRNNVKRWLTEKVKNTLPKENILTTMLEFIGFSPTFSDIKEVN